MKGKLIKRSNGRFDLYAIEDINQVNTIASSFDNPKGKLSVKNCESIELGYDLDELAEKHSETLWGGDKDNIGRASFYIGAKNILEILGDKKFSEEELSKAYYRNENRFKSEPFEVFVQSLQQAEWDVEILM